MSKLLTAADVQEMILEFVKIKRDLMNDPYTKIDSDSLFNQAKTIQESQYEISIYNMKQYATFNGYLTDFYTAIEEEDDITNFKSKKAIDCLLNGFGMLYVALLLDSE